jgi:hypothetical protein
VHLSKENKKILKEWLYSNKECPYATVSDMETLIIRTRLSPTQIKNWLKNQRQNCSFLKKKNPYFSDIETETLKSFYIIKQHPGPKDLLDLAAKLNKDKNKINRFFINERFKQNKLKKMI